MKRDHVGQVVGPYAGQQGGGARSGRTADHRPVAGQAPQAGERLLVLRRHVRDGDLSPLVPFATENFDTVGGDDFIRPLSDALVERGDLRDLRRLWKGIIANRRRASGKLRPDGDPSITTYQRNASSWPIDAPIDYPIKTRADLQGYRPPDPTLPGRAAEIEVARDMDNGDIALLGGIQGPLTTLWLLMGYEAISYALYDDPALIGELCALSNAFFKEAARRSVEAGCIGIWVSEDLGDSTRGFFRLEHYRRYLLPPFVELVDYVDGLGVPVLLHSCGRITDYLEDLAQTKIAAVHPLQRTAGMDLGAVKARYGDRFCIIGNIDSSRTLPYGTPEEVAAEVREAIDIAAPGGGYVLACDVEDVGK